MADSFKISRRDLLKIGAVVASGITTTAFERAAEARGKSSPQPQDLRCEYLSDPIGIDEVLPRLSWTYAMSGDRGWQQASYQIQVATSAENLKSGKIDLWDSSIVASTQSSQIPYGGALLTARQGCYWQVRVWGDDKSEPLWSKTGYWEMGLLTAADWKNAVWIGRAVDGADAGPAPYLRSEFMVAGKVQRARVYSCGLGYADISINGKRLGETTERETAYTDYNKRALYVTHDVTKELNSGNNAIGAVLGSGWYDVNDLATWNFDKASWKGDRRLLLTLVVEFADGTTTQTIVSDGNWKAATGPVQRDGIYSGEIYDARLELSGWDLPGYDDSQWKAADILPAPAGVVKALRCPPVRLTKTLPAVSIAEPSAGVYVADFGQNLSGHVQLSLKAPAGTTIKLRYAELIHPDGSLNTGNIETLMNKTNPPQLFQTDTYICKGGGSEEVWEQRFSYSGFRFAEITGLPFAPSTSNFSSRFAHTDLESAGDFTCSDAMLNKLQQATRWSYLSNAQSIPTDCPQREKNGWTGDAHLAADTGLMNFRSATFYTKWLDDFADNQLSDGQVGIIVPTQGWGRGDCHPAWDSAYPFVAWDLYQYLGDLRILERHYNNIRSYVDYLTTRLEDGVIPFDSLGDWVPWKTETPSQFTSTIYFYRDSQIVSQAARLLGKGDDADKYAALADATKAAFNAKWFDSTTKTYLPGPPANGGQTAQAMPLHYGLVPDGSEDSVFTSLVANVEQLGHIDTGILGAKSLLIVLTKNGLADLAYKLITNKDQPSWAWWIEQGGTTLWESWPGGDSHNHIMFGHISNWFIQSVAGIGLDPSSPWFKNIVVKPQSFEPLTSAAAYHESPQGRIESSWKRDSGGFHLDVIIPPGSTATVWIPASQASTVTEGNRPIATVPGIAFVKREGDSNVYMVGSGSYSFLSA
jgi:alpha-L-rhamnosidase